MFLVHWIVGWLLAALALWLVAQILPGFSSAIRHCHAGHRRAGPARYHHRAHLRLIAWPITFLTLGLFRWVVKAIVFETDSHSHAGLPDREGS